MKTLKAILLILGILLACIAGCSRPYSFSGIVLDGQGVGIGDARIILYPHDQKRPRYNDQYSDGKTDSDGTFEAGWCCATGVRFFRIVVSKSGYDDDTRIVSANEKGIRVVLSLVGGKTE